MSNTMHAARRGSGLVLSRRAFLRLAGFAAAGAAASCIAAPAAGPGALVSVRPTAGPGKVQLVYQDWRSDWYLPMAQRMLEAFHASHPNIRVFYVPEPENLEDKMLADMQAGTAADVFAGPGAYLPIWAQKGYTVDLRPYIADLEPGTLTDWDTVQYRAFFAPNGQLYGLPKFHGALALYYNKDLFDAYGVTYPDASWDHNSYGDAMRRLTDDRDGDNRTDLWGSMLDVAWERIQVHVNGWGGHLVDPQNPALCAMAQSEAMAAVGWLRARMWDDDIMATPLGVRKMQPYQAFLAGKVAMIEEGSWLLKDILSGANFRIGVAPFPAGPVRRVTLATTDGFAIYSGTRHVEPAWELVKFLTGQAYGRAMAEANFLQPARASLVDEWVGYVRREFPQRARDVDVAAFAHGHVNGYSVTPEIFADMAEARHLTHGAWDQILTLGKAPVTILPAVCRQIEAAQTAGDPVRRQG
jgi:multiple sugar transport system substrate-binding protein